MLLIELAWRRTSESCSVISLLAVHSAIYFGIPHPNLLNDTVHSYSITSSRARIEKLCFSSISSNTVGLLQIWNKR